MSKEFVEIDAALFDALEKRAKACGFKSVAELLTAVAKGFSPRCSVTPCGKTRAPSTPFPRAGVVSPAAR